jgi:hypothetical protein
MEMIPNPWDPPINEHTGEGPLVARPTDQLGEVDTSTLKGPTLVKARGWLWQSLTREAGRVGMEPLEWIPRSALDLLAINSRPHLTAPGTEPHRCTVHFPLMTYEHIKLHNTHDL